MASILSLINKSGHEKPIAHRLREHTKRSSDPDNFIGGKEFYPDIELRKGVEAERSKAVIQATTQRVVVPDVGWKPYTLLWTSSGTQPVINNGSITAYYIRTGKLCLISYVFVFGGTTTFGTGTYSFSLPIPSLTSVISAHSIAYLTDTSAGTNQFGMARNVTSALTTFQILSSIGNVAATSPFVWATTDTIRGSLCYPIL